MYLSKQEAWKGLIYTLLYPALLGSMLYDIFSPSAGFSWNYVAQITLVCIYLVDYLYLYNDWMSEGYPNGWHEIICDGIISVLYRLSFGFVGRYHPAGASICLVLLFSLYFGYEIAKNTATRRFIATTVAVLSLNLAMWLFVDNVKLRTIVFASTTAITLGLLSVYVFYYAPTFLARHKADPNECPP